MAWRQTFPLAPLLLVLACGDDAAESTPHWHPDPGPDVEPDPGGEAAPRGAIAKADLDGEWIGTDTTLSISSSGTWSFEGEQRYLPMKLRWEIREEALVGYQSFEFAPGVDGGTEDPALPPETGYVADDTRCFDATSGRELRCRPDRNTGEPGLAGEPNVICSDPDDAQIDCFPYPGPIAALFPIRRHLDLKEERGRIVVDESRPWNEREHVEVDWSRNLVEDPLQRVFNLLDEPLVVDFVGADDAHDESFHLERDRAGKLIHFDFVSRAHVEPPYEIVGEGASAYKQHRCSYSRHCGPAEVRMRTAFRRVDRSIGFAPRPYDAVDMARFPLFRDVRIGYDAFEGPLVARRREYAMQYQLWKESFAREPDGTIVRDANGAPVPLPFAEREIEPIRFHLTGPWPTELVGTVEAVIGAYDAVFRQAVAFQQEVDVASVPSVVVLDFNGLHKRVDATGVEPVCAALEARGRAKQATLADGRPACDFSAFAVDLGPEFGVAPSERDVEWSFEEGDVRARLGDLLHHRIHWAPDHQPASPLGYGPAVSDPETGRVIVGQAAVYGAALSRTTTQTLDAINVQNGRLREEDFVAGRPDALLDEAEAAVHEPFDAAGFLTHLGAEARSAPLGELPAVLLGTDQAAWLSQRRGAPRAASAGQPLFDAVIAEDPELADLVAADDVEVDADEEGRRTAARIQRALSRNITLAEMYDDALTAPAARFKDRPTADLRPGGPVWQELRKEILKPLVAHELGHTFGLRHNYKGSHDATNYDDAYWELRRENLRPAEELETIDDMIELVTRTPDQIAGGMDAQVGSSVMDYDQPLFGPAEYLGRYDVAALMASYAGAAEVFDWEPETVDETTRARLRDQAVSGRVTGRTYFAEAHYTQIPYLLGGDLDEGLERLRRRRWVSWATLREQLESEDPGAPIPVPYETCTDFWWGAAESCFKFDSGADDLEITRDAATRLENAYFLGGFRRDRVSWPTPAQYASNLLQNQLAPMRNVYQHGMSRLLAGAIDYGKPSDATWLAATSAGLRAMSRLLHAPRYGTYAPDDEGEVCWFVDEGLGDGPTVPIGPGRRLDPRHELGDFHAPELSEIGHRWVRRAVLYTLMLDASGDGALGLVDLGIGYVEGANHSLDAMLGDSFLGEMGGIGPRLTDEGVRFPDVIDIGAAPEPLEGCVLESALDDRERRAQMVYAAAFLRDSMTLAIQHRARVFRIGTSEEPPLPEGATLIAFTDPETGIRYGAHQIEAVWPRDALAARLVARGAAVEHALQSPWLTIDRSEALRAELRTLVEDAEFLRSTIRRFDTVTVGAP